MNKPNGWPIGSLCIKTNGPNKGAVVTVLSAPRLMTTVNEHTGIRSLPKWVQDIRPQSFWIRGPHRIPPPATLVSEPRHLAPLPGDKASSNETEKRKEQA